MDGQLFKEEFQRLMRAINDSLEREAELQRLLRRTKESLISVALRLQVAIKISQEDELLIQSLLSQAAESKARELVSNKQAQEAQELIQALNLEINTLKRRLRTAELEKNTGGAVISSTNSKDVNTEIMNQMNIQADAEVDSLMTHQLHIPVLPGTAGRPEAATPFNRWKMQQFMYTPDTPAASEAHEREVVDMLMQAAEYSLREDHLRMTKSGIAKMKPALTPAQLRDSRNHGYDYRLGTANVLGANDYEGKGEDFVDVATSGYGLQPLQKKRDNGEFFLDANLLQWGTAPRFDKDNMGRTNLWATTSSSTLSGPSKPLPSTAREGVKRSGTAAGGQKTREGSSSVVGSANTPVKLKSLRHNNGSALNLSASMPSLAGASGGKLVI